CAEVDAERQTAHNLATLFCAGVRLDWTNIESAAAPPQPALPNYPFQRERYWLNEATVDEADPLLAALQARASAMGARTPAETLDLQRELDGKGESERQEVLLRFIQGQVAAELGLPAQVIALDQSFFDMGMDSL